jgi:hypothetical protein
MRRQCCDLDQSDHEGYELCSIQQLITVAAWCKAWMFVFNLCLCWVAALQRADPLSKESCQLSYIKKLK